MKLALLAIVLLLSCGYSQAIVSDATLAQFVYTILGNATLLTGSIFLCNTTILSASPATAAAACTFSLGALGCTDCVADDLTFCYCVNEDTEEVSYLATTVSFCFPAESTGILKCPRLTGVVCHETTVSGGCPSATEGCTRSSTFWKYHNPTSSSPNLTDWLLSENQTICEELWVDIIEDDPTGNTAYTRLAKEFIAALLNLAEGADPTSYLFNVLNQADAFLTNYCDEALSASERQTAETLRDALELYNVGIIGPGLCEEDEDAEPETDTVDLTSLTRKANTAIALASVFGGLALIGIVVLSVLFAAKINGVRFSSNYRR